MTPRLHPLTLPVFEALLAGDVPTAERLVGLTLPAEFVARAEIWEYMISLLTERPENRDWVMNAVVVGSSVVGNAGFKGAPVDGVVELGYTISPDHRRRGHALAATRLLLDRARREPTVETVVATIAPDNDASVGVVTKAGFAPAGDRVHPRWGRQLVFSADVR